jgi:hypothetical protein
VSRTEELLHEAFQRLSDVPYHRNPHKPVGDPYGYPPEGHKEYSCPVCITLDRIAEHLRLGLYGEADEAWAKVTAAIGGSDDPQPGTTPLT